MRIPQGKNNIGRLLAVFFVIAAIVIYLAAFHNPSADDSKEASTSREDRTQGEAETTPNETEPAIESPKVTDPGRELLKDRQYASKNPLYFRVVFGREGTTSTLGVIDESSGTGTGYDVAYVDENRNGDLTDDGAKKFPRDERGPQTEKLNPRFAFRGPLKGEESANYTLNIYSLASGAPASARENGYYFFWSMDTKDWNYFFINGKARLFSSADEALKGAPIRFGGDCKWEISSRTKDGKAMVSAGLKDENGCTLRLVRLSGKILSPRLSLAKNGKIEAEKELEFG
jgi:hypothetical protein